MKKCAIVLNTPLDICQIKEEFIIAADGGYKHVFNQKRDVDVFIGDNDSCQNACAKQVIKLKVEKNETDGQAALQYAIDNKFKEVVFYGITGGRLDHVLSNLSLLKKAKSTGLRAMSLNVDCTIMLLGEGNYTFDISKGTTFSLLTFSSAVIDNSKGVKYNFKNLKITASQLGRSISNEANENKISFDVIKGEVFFIVNK